MALIVRDFTIEQGATFKLTFVWKTQADGNPPPPPEIVNLTGYTARMQLRKTVRSSTVLDSLTTENGRIVITPTEGKIVSTFPATTTAGYNFLECVYDLELDKVGVVTRFAKGTITVDPEVTRG